MNYLDVLDATFVMHVVRPFALNTSAKIVAAPRVYGFDTGFVAYHRGWSPLRRDDYGPLWEHVVLNEIHASRQRRDVQYPNGQNVLVAADVKRASTRRFKGLEVRIVGLKHVAELVG